MFRIIIFEEDIIFMKKRLLSAALALTMLAVPFAASYSAYAEEIGSVAASGEDDNNFLTDGDYRYEVLEDGTAVIRGYTGAGGDLVLPEKLGGKTVTVIGQDAFIHNHDITGVTIPKTVKKLEMDCFGWTNVETAVIPDNVIEEESSFSGCDKLTSYKIGKNLKVMYFTFWGCDGLTEAKVPGTVKEMTCAFSNCKGLKKVTIENGVETVGYHCFSECDNLTEVVIPASVTDIEGNAFDDTPNVTIVGVKGSYAEEYAKEHNIPFKTEGSAPAPTPTPNPEPAPLDIPSSGILGDMDGDKQITSGDAMIILRASIGVAVLNGDQTKAADVDGDGSATSSDSIKVLRFSIGLDQSDTIGKAIK